MIEGVLTTGAVWAEVRGAPPEGGLVPGEEALVARAVTKRRRAFAAGRSCAHRALDELGAPAGPVLSGPGGEPLWPEGVSGSITHCAGYAAAAVAWATDVPTLGIDAEPHGPLPAGVLDAVARSEERARIRKLAEDHPTVHWDRVLFSAKESVYKAWYPRARRMLGFEDADVTIGGDGTLTVHLLVPGPLEALTGRWTVADGLVLTATSRVL